MRINYERIVHYIYHHYISIILVSALLSIVSGYFAAKLKIKADNAALLPDDYVSVQVLNHIKERVGGIGPLMVVIIGDDLEKSVEFMLTLADSLEHNPLISSVNRDKNRQFWNQNALLYMGAEDLEEIYTRVKDHIELEKLKRSPLYVSLDDDDDDSLDFSDLDERLKTKYPSYADTGLERNYYLTKEKDGAILRLYPAGIITDVEFTKKLLASIDSTIAVIDPRRFHSNIKYTYSGSFKNANDQYKLILNDLLSTALYAFVGVLLLICLFLRQILSPLIIVIPLLMSISWTFGLTYLTIGNLNLITVCLFAVLFGLGIDFGIHIFARYREARQRNLDVEAALDETVCHTGSALTTTALTTAVAFFVLVFTDFKGFSEFGFIVGIGILFSLVAMLTTCPAFIVLAERLGWIRLQRKSVPPHLLRRGTFPRPLLTLVLGFLAMAYSLYHMGLGELAFEYDFKKLRPATSGIDARATLPDKLKETRSPAIVLTENRAEAEEVVRTVRALKARNGEKSTIRSVKSVYSALPKAQSQKLKTIARIRALIDAEEDLIKEADPQQRSKIDSLRKLLDISALTLKDLPKDVTSKFTSKEGELLSFVMINADVPLRDGRNAINFAREISEVHTPEGKTYYASSAHIIFAEMLQLMLREGLVAITLTLLVVALVLFIDLRNLFDTLLVLTPLLAALCWTTGFMYLFDIRLNVYNMVAFPTMIGMGIDNGVHIFHRYREEGRGSLRLVLRTTGMALLATSLTTMMGFASLVSAHHPALFSIGQLSLIGLGCCFIAAITLLPSLLQMRERKMH